MHKKSVKNWIILLIISIIWGSSFILMKKSLVKFTYLEVGFFRLIIAFFILLPFFVATMKKIDLKHVFPLLIVSLVGTVIPAILFAQSQIYLNSSVAGMLNGLTPIFTLIIGILIFKEKYWHQNNIVGIIIGLLGTYILLLPQHNNVINTKYSLMIILATFCYAISINTIKTNLSSLKPLDIAVSTSFLSCIIPIFYIYHIGVSNTLEKIAANLMQKLVLNK